MTVAGGIWKCWNVVRASQTMLLHALQPPTFEVARRLKLESMRGLRVYHAYTRCTAASTQDSYKRNQRFGVTSYSLTAQFRAQGAPLAPFYGEGGARPSLFRDYPPRLI